MMFKIDLNGKDADYIATFLDFAYDGCEFHCFIDDTGTIFQYDICTRLWQSIETDDSFSGKNLVNYIKGNDAEELALYLLDPCTPSEFLANPSEEIPFVIFNLDEDSYHFILELNEVVSCRPDVNVVLISGNAISTPLSFLNKGL